MAKQKPEVEPPAAPDPPAPPVAEVIDAEVVEPEPPPPTSKAVLERSTVAWLAYLFVQHLLWLIEAVRLSATLRSKGPRP